MTGDQFKAGWALGDSDRRQTSQGPTPGWQSALFAHEQLTRDELEGGSGRTRPRSNNALRPPDWLNQPDRRRAQAINKERVDSGFGGPARQRREHAAGSRDLARALAQLA